MSFEYIIPPEVKNAELAAPYFLSQVAGPNDIRTQLSVGKMHYTEILDRVQCTFTPRGIGGRLVYVYNFTNFPICLIDNTNAITIIDSAYNSNLVPQDGLHGKIIVEVATNNQDQKISQMNDAYLKRRREAFVGMDLGYHGDNCYNDEAYDNTISAKASQNQRLRFIITDPLALFKDNGGAFYLRDANIVIGMMNDPNKIWLHPDSEKTIKLKARPKMKNTESLGVEVYINDNEHVFDKAFVNVAGEVLEVPVTRNANEPNQISLWFDVHSQGTTPMHYKFDDRNCPVEIYRSRADALSGGSPDKVIDKEILEIKAKLAKEKTEYDQAEFERQRIRAEEQAQRQREELENQRREKEKDQQLKHEQAKYNQKVEKVSFWRKFMVEGVKTVAAVAACVTSAVGLYLKYKAA